MADHELPVSTRFVVSNRPRVLVVDDDARGARLLGRMLRDEGFDTEVAIDGASAIGRLERRPAFDILITDFHVTGADGLVIATRARAVRPGIPVFVVTGDPQAGALPLADPIKVITKPFGFQVLVGYLNAAVADYRPATPPSLTQ